jgi:hypothetical protein
VKSIIPASAATAVATLLLALSGCTEPAQEAAAEDPALATPVPVGMVRGTAVETMDAGGYTYVLLDLGAEQQYWIAGPKTAVTAGDVVQTVEQGMPMPGFKSETLGRTFEMLFFVNAISNLSAPDATATVAHPPMTPATAAPDAPITVAALEDGRDIAYVYANKDDLAGQAVSLRGEVVKYNENILGWNFIHIQDGSGDANDRSNDLTVTSKAATAVGETIVVTGTIVLEKDFGAGYTYPILMEDASVTVEP